MASGILVASGQVWVLDAIQTKVAAGLYVGLMSNTSQPSETSQLPYASGLTEITDSLGGPVACSGYERKLSSSWTVVSGLSPYLIGSSVTFVPSGAWPDVYGYFVSTTLTGYNALWIETFPPDQGGTMPSGVSIVITPRYYQE
jgi:hypothetical protein